MQRTARPGWCDEVAAFILAGGRSRRMGRDKARLEVDGVALAQLLARRLAPWVERVWLVTKPGTELDELGIPVLFDATTDQALVTGLRTALRAPGPAWRFVLACDMPDVGPAELESLWRVRASDGRGSAPRLPGRSDPEPLPSLWHRDVAGRVGVDWGLAARDWVRRAGLVAWEVPEGRVPAFVHCNTPEEWQTWLERHRGARAPRPHQP